METLAQRRDVNSLTVVTPERKGEESKETEPTATSFPVQSSLPSLEEQVTDKAWQETTSSNCTDGQSEEGTREDKKQSDTHGDPKQALDELKLKNLMKNFDEEWSRLLQNGSFSSEETSSPSEEPVVDFCSCALEYYYILRQGWLYITPKFLCFTAGILGGWGSRLVRVFAFADITAIRKRTYLSFDTAIEIELQGTPYLFATFLKREKTYETLYRYWMNIMAVRAFEDRLPARVRDPQSAHSHGDSTGYPESPKSLTTSSSLTMEPYHKVAEETNHDIQKPVSIKTSERDTAARDNLATGKEEGIPRPADKGHLINIGHHSFAISVEQLFQLAFSDTSVATYDFQKRLGNTDIHVSKWKLDPNEKNDSKLSKSQKKKLHNGEALFQLQSDVTYTRSIRYMKTIWAGLMTWKTKVVEMQWCKVTSEKGIVVGLDIETTIKTLHNPNSESFFVYQRDFIRAKAQGGCELIREFSVIFLQKTMFKGVILRETEKQCRAGFELFMDTIRLLLGKNTDAKAKREEQLERNQLRSLCSSCFMLLSWKNVCLFLIFVILFILFLWHQSEKKWLVSKAQQQWSVQPSGSLHYMKEYLWNQRQLLRAIEKELDTLEQMIDRLEQLE
ncbi:protein vascular associated death 1, chloroplastic [Galdieria sulphuraria]|nr:protein vascular associated death 1, chloroplastic [Galdieria sulphuraria]